METKRPPGRPPKGGEPQTARIHLRAQPSEKDRYERAAEKAGLPLADWIKERLNRAAKREIGD